MPDNSFQRSSEQWVKAVRNDEKGAFRELFFTFHEPLCHFAAQYVRASDIAEEVVQEVFAKFWEQRDDLDPDQSIKAYLYRSVKNKAIDFQRRHKTEKKYLERATQDDIDRTKAPKVKLEKKSEFEVAAQRAIENLPKRSQRVYKLSRKDGLTYKEIASVMDISHKTVESQISRALKKLRKKLRPHLTAILIAFLSAVQPYI